MAEIAGLALGGIPIALWALEKYHDPVKSYWKYDQTLSTLRDSVFVQQRQLDITLGLIGLNQPTLDELHECLRDKYPHQHKEFISIIGHMGHIIQKLLRKLNVDIHTKPPWASEARDRVQWEWRRVKRGLGTKERKALVDELQYWNTALKTCIERPEVPAEDENLAVQELQARFNPGCSDTIRENARAIHGVLKDSWNCGCVYSHYGAIDLDWRSEQLANPSVFDIALSFRDAPTRTEDCWRKYRIKIEESDSNTAVTDRSVPSLQSSRVGSPASSTGSPKSRLSRLLGKPHDKASVQVTAGAVSDTVKPATTPRSDIEISCLCAEVRKKCTPSKMLGYLPDPEEQQDRRFHLSHASKGKPSIVKFMPLKSLLLQEPAPAHQLPPHLALSAKQRYGLAAALAWTVLHLSRTPWLDESWDREQVNVFLESSAAGQEVIARSPCISYPFRGHAASSILTPSNRFISNQIRNGTLFALGIFLIELCVNKPFEELRQLNPRGSTPTTIPDDFQIAESKIDEVYNQAGDSYGYAVQRCLRCEFPGRDVTKDFESSTFRRHFYNNVVAPIQATYMKHP